MAVSAMIRTLSTEEFSTIWSLFRQIAGERVRGGTFGHPNL